MFLSKKEWVTGVLVLAVITLIVAGARWSVLYDSDAISAEDTVSVYLHEKMGLKDLTTVLIDSGLVKNKEQFEWAARTSSWSTFQEGHYRVEEGYSYAGFLSKLARGLQDPVSVTILPGRSEASIIEAIAGTMQFGPLELANTLNDTAFVKELDLRPEEVLGRLYPNTYDFYWTASPEVVVKRVVDVFNRAVVDRHKNRIQEMGQSVNDIITIASIIEWEAYNDDEKNIISGLYWNRLERDMRLQADPTINFAVGERRRLHYKDYKVDHPYNTYLYDGLPPGPVTNPEMSSIEAALFPEDHDYLYMVATPEGGHDFSKTFEEHKQRSAKWRQWLQEQYRIKEERESGSNSR